ncbi:MAG: ABC transporter permease subunit [Pseudomonadota bacterium]
MNHIYSKFITKEQRSFNVFDVLVLIVLFAALCAITWGAGQMAQPYKLGEQLAISLSPSALPFYAIRTVMRMFLGLFLSFVFTFTVATLAAHSKRAARVIIPFMDIMQSIPVLGFLSISVVPFILLFPNSMLGPECAAVFAIFTAQAWNMALSFYQSLKSIPKELTEATAMLQLSPWQTFWRLKVPFAMPTLLWNTMMSMSAAWFFVVASEAIHISNQSIYLPGIGSYIQVALNQNNHWAMCYAVITMFIVILIYDQLFLRPLLSWSERFKGMNANDRPIQPSWFLSWLRQARWLNSFSDRLDNLKDLFLNPLHERKYPIRQRSKRDIIWPKFKNYLSMAIWNVLSVGILVWSLHSVVFFVLHELPLSEVKHVFLLGSYTALRVFCSVVIASCIWVPVATLISLRPKLAQNVQIIAQFGASFPANILYPLFFAFMVRYHLSLEWCSVILMFLGTQWYILFNVIGGAIAIPNELFLAVSSYKVRGWLWWRRFMLPAVFPHYVTGAMTAAGACWNASILAEIIQSGDMHLEATGLGAYITQATATGDFPRIALSIGVMSLYVILFNHLVWQKLYRLAQERYSES